MEGGLRHGDDMTENDGQDCLFGPNPSGLDESPHGMMVLVFVGMFAGGQFGSRRQVVCGDGCQRILAVRGGSVV